MFTLDHRYGDTSPLRFDWLARIASTIARFRSRTRQARHVRRTITELKTLDDGMLKDIGLYRCHIESAALNAWRPEWYGIPQTHRTMSARNLTEWHNNNDI